MSKNILFISEQFLKDSSFLSENVDPKHIKPMIKAAQDRYIHPLLGTALYNKLQEYVKGSTETPAIPIPEAYKTLLDDYLADTQVWYTLAQIPIPLQFKLVNKGVVQRSDQTIQTTSSADRKNLIDSCMGWAEWYAQRTIEHLKANTDKFPEYLDQGGNREAITPDKTQYRTGIYLGKTPKVRTGKFEDKYQ